MTPRAVITGGQGQLGRALLATAPFTWDVTALTSSELDVTRRDRVDDLFHHERPALVVNAAAYTAVDQAEREPERAAAVNTAGAEHIACAAEAVGARVIQISTDFVFDGGQGTPYLPDAPAAPLGVYGATKLAGERAAARATGGRALIVRTAWLYSAHGHSFVRTMLRLMREQDEVRVVADRVGTPTWARSLADAIWAAAADRSISGVHHWTDAGVASWYDFAVAIQEEALALGILTRAVPIRPLRTADYPTPATRPPYSVLDKTRTWAVFGRVAEHWRTNLRHSLRELVGA